MKKTVISCVCMMVAAACFCHGEIIELIDGTKMSGTITHAYVQAVEIKCEGGELLVLQLQKIRSVTFAKPVPKPEFATPEKSFEHFLSLMRQGNVEKTVNCYRLMYQKMISEEIAGMSPADKAGMQEAMVKTEFRIGKAVIEGNKARLPVWQKTDGKEQQAEVVLVRENGEWKLAMPLLSNDERAEQNDNAELELRDGTKVKGEIIHIYGSSVEIKGRKGELIELDKNNIRFLKIISDKPRTEFSAPEKTFSYYISLLKQGKIEETVECYRLMLQTVIASQIASMAFEDRVAIQKSTAETKFKYGKAEITGDKAVLKVTRIAGREKDTAEVLFIKENNEWKLSMPSGMQKTE